MTEKTQFMKILWQAILIYTPFVLCKFHFHKISKNNSFGRLEKMQNKKFK